MVHGVPLVYCCTPTSKNAQLIIPATHGLCNLLDELHTSALAGHLGVRKMLDLLYQQVWWPKMRQSVATYVANCDLCKWVEYSTQQVPGAL